MEKQAFWPYSSFFAAAAKTQALIKDAVPLTMIKPVKRKEKEIQEEGDADVSTELTVSCGSQRKSKKLRRSEASSSKSFPTQKDHFADTIVGSRVTVDSEREVFYSKKNQSQEEVSTKLTLFDESWITKNKKLMEDSAYNFSAAMSRSKKPLSKAALEEELKQKVVASKISAMKYYSPREEEEERRLGVSTKLRLGVSTKQKLYEDPYKIRKELTESDVGNLCRLLVKKSLVMQHILPYLSNDSVESDDGARVMVWDQDTESVHQLSFKKWAKSKSYVFIENWSNDFVGRRDLEEGDEIGLFWDPYYSRFNFSVLKRVPRH